MIFYLDDKFSSYFEDSKKNFDAFMKIKGDVFRSVKTRKTLRFEMQGKSFFIKQHFGVGIIEILKNLLSLRPIALSAKNEWQAIQKLQKAGIKVPSLVAYGERGLNPANIQSFVVTEDFSARENLADFIRNNMVTDELKTKIIKAIAHIAKTMHGLGIYHRDFYILHFMIDAKQWHENKIVDLLLYDFHRAGISHKVSRRWLVKDLGSLYFSIYHIGKKLNDIDLETFYTAYFDKPFNEIKKEKGPLLKAIREKALKIQNKE